MKLSIDSVSNRGGREYNQDFIAYQESEGSACLVVCDGLGSYSGSEIVSRLASERFVELYSENTGEETFTPAGAREITKSVQNYINEQKERIAGISSSCTTIASVLTNYNNTLLLHIGDTRVYFFKNRKLHFCTHDHSLAQYAADSGEIKQADVRIHKDQNKLTRVLGSGYYIPPDIDIYSEPLQPGDVFVLCTDGFWEYVYEEDMCTIIEESVTATEALVKMEALVKERADKYNDNYSAIIAFVSED